MQSPSAADNRTALNAAERAADPERYTTPTAGTDGSAPSRDWFAGMSLRLGEGGSGPRLGGTMASDVTPAQRTMFDAGFGPLRAKVAQDVIDTRDWLIDNTDYRMYLQPAEAGAGRGFVNPPSATAVDSMGQPLYGRSNYNALAKGREIIGGFFDDPLGTVGKLGDWLTYTTPDAQQLRAEINGRYGADPRYSLIDQVAASPLGGSAYGITNLLGASPETQQLALGTFTALDGLLMSAAAIKGQAPSFLGTQRPGAMDVESPYALTSNNYLSGLSRTDKMGMGIRLEANQGLLDNYTRWDGQSATQLYVRSFDANGNLLPGSVRLDRVGLRADGGYDLIDYKLSPNSPLTANQGLHYPALSQYGGIVTGQRGFDIGLPQGRVLPPTTVEVKTGPVLRLDR